MRHVIKIRHAYLSGKFQKLVMYKIKMANQILRREEKLRN